MVGLFQKEKHIRKHDSEGKWADIMIGMDFSRMGGKQECEFGFVGYSHAQWEGGQ